MAKPDLGRSPKPGRLIAWTIVWGIVAMLTSAWQFPPAVAAWIWGVALLAIILVGCVAAVAWSAWLHRFTVFTNMKANVDPN